MQHVALRAWIPAALLMAVIAWFSHQPSWPSALVGFPDWLLHGAAYAALGAASYWGASRELRDRGTSALLVAVLVAAAYGGLDEWHQSFVPGRDASLHDWLADALGVVLGALGTARAFARR